MRHTDVHLVERNGTIQNWFEMYRQTDQTRMCLNSRQPVRLNIQRLVVKTEEISLQDKERQPQQLPSAHESTYLEYSGGRSGRSVFTLFLSALCLLAIGCANADSDSEASGNTMDALVSTGIDAGITEFDALTTIEDAATPQPDPVPEPEPPCESTNLMPAAFRGDMTYPTAEAGEVVTLGQGHDTRLSELLQTCVQGQVGTTSGENVDYELHEIETREQLSENLRVNVRVSAGFGGFGLKGRFRMARAREVSRYDLNIWMRVRVHSHSQSLVNDVRLKPEFEDLLDIAPLEFVERCGDRFVQKVSYGGELLVVLSIATESESDRRDLSARLSASFGLFGSADASMDENTFEALEGREVTLLIDRVGGGGQLPDLRTARELIEYARNFPNEVAGNDPVVFEYVTRPFDRVTDGHICLPGFDPKSIRLIDEAWEYLNEAVDIRNALEEAIENPADYACGNNQQRREDLAYLGEFIDDLDGLAESCALEMANQEREVFTGQSCRALEQLLASYTAPQVPLRWETTVSFEASSRGRFHTFNISEQLVCADPVVSGLWSMVSSNGRCPNVDHCWLPCPTGERVGPEYQLTFEDSAHSDNRGVCTYEFKCMHAEDAYLLEACEPDE